MYLRHCPLQSVGGWTNSGSHLTHHRRLSVWAAGKYNGWHTETGQLRDSLVTSTYNARLCSNSLHTYSITKSPSATDKIWPRMLQRCVPGLLCTACCWWLITSADYKLVDEIYCMKIGRLCVQQVFISSPPTSLHPCPCYDLTEVLHRFVSSHHWTISKFQCCKVFIPLY